MKLDSLEKLFVGSWNRLKDRFDAAIKIFIVPAVLILISQMLLTRSSLSALALGQFINFIGGIVSVFASIALIATFGKRAGFAESYRKGFTLFWAFIWIAVLVVLAVIGGFVMLIIPGIMLAVQLAFAVYVLVLEDKRGMAALAESREYLKGYWWAFVGRSILLSLSFLIINIIILIPAKLIFGGLVGAIVYAAGLLVFVPFSVAYHLEIYENLRRLKPGVAEAAAKVDRGFLKVSVVVGIFGAFLLLIFIILAAIFVPALILRHGGGGQVGSYNYGYGNPPVELGTSTLQLQMAPTSGPVGTTVTISAGSGGSISLDATNMILMNGLVAARDVVPSADGTLSFTVPASLAPNCAPGEACPQFLLHVSPGAYQVAAQNSQGTIPVGTFTVY